MNIPYEHICPGCGKSKANSAAPCRCSAEARPTHLTKAELYQAACAPVELPDNFIASLRWHLIRDEDMVPCNGDNMCSSPKDVALRVAVSHAHEWRDLARASHELEQDVTCPDDTPEERQRAMYAMGQNHQARYCANTMLRDMAREMYRNEVPEEERVL